MPKPENVNPHNFKVSSIIYKDGIFSIAWGEWEDGNMHLAMRWDGEDDAGYPKTFGHPVWFLVPSNLTVEIASGISKNPSSDFSAINNIINSLTTS